MIRFHIIMLRLISRIGIVAFAFFLVVLLNLTACTKPGTDESGENTILVKSIKLNEAAYSMTEGESFRLIATIYPEDATNQKISWSSDSPQVATVDNTGMVMARQPGTATISVFTEDGNKTASCLFTIDALEMPSVTLGASNISAVSAVLSGKANLGNASSADLKMGIMYSKSSGVLPSSSTIVEATEIDSEYYYRVSITGLDPGTIYYYRSYIYQAGTNTYGETKSFNTKDSSVIITSDASVLGPTEAITNANVDLTNCLCTSLIYGFYYGNDVQHMDSFVRCNEIDDSHNYAWLFRGLIPATTYYYQAAAVMDGREFRGRIMSYKTPEIDATVNTLTARNITNFKATLNARFATINADTLSKEVWFLYSKTASTLDALKSKGIKVTCSLNADGSFNTSLSGLNENTIYYYLAVAKVYDKEFYGQVDSFITHKTAPDGAVDLGLSVFWATSNLNANGLCANPQDYGDYYAWGETKPKSDYSWSTYKWGKGEGSLTKYNTYSSDGIVDNITELQRGEKSRETVDDAARAKLGGKWRMPTEAECTELMDNSTREWTSDYNGTGVAGIIVTSKKTGYTDTSIFLPAAGSRYSTSLESAGKYGDYWSSSLYYSSTAGMMSFYKYGDTYGGTIYVSIDMDPQYRCCGQSVRPVTE